jgi:hypothetical protein
MESGLVIAELTSAGFNWMAKGELQQQLDHRNALDPPRHNKSYAKSH